MTKKEYDGISAVLSFVRRQNPSPAARAAIDEVIEEFCIWQQDNNPAFKRQRFEVDASYRRDTDAL